MTAVVAVLWLWASASDCSAELERLLARNAPTVLKEYRVPTAADVHAEWKAYVTARRVCPYMTSADWNEDGRPDHAFILPRKESEGFVVAVLLSTSGKLRFQVLERSDTGSAWKRGVVFLQGEAKQLAVGGERSQQYRYDATAGAMEPVQPLVID